MRRPAFWSRPTSFAATALTPVAHLWAAIADARLRRPKLPPPLPMICVGNFVAGGAGKTPIVAALCARLKQKGRAPFILARGYGGTLSSEQPLLVDPSRHLATQVGDEPLMLARSFAVVICKDREAAAALAARLGADALVLDDGLQSLVFDCATLAVVDAHVGFGNGRVIPSGPLRASLDAQWEATSAVILLGHDDEGGAIETAAATRGLPVYRGALVPTSPEHWRGKRVFAFAGIGAPDKFFRMLSDVGAVILGSRAFPDHYAYRDEDLSALASQALACGAECLATTEKDAIRFQGSPVARASDPPIETLEISAQPKDADAFESWIDLTLRRFPPSPPRG